MVGLVAQNIDALRALCQKHHVKSLYLFGSAANGKFEECSDIDFLYEMDHNVFSQESSLDYATNFFELENALASLFQRRVDLVRNDVRSGSLLLQKIGSNKQLIYAA